ncbi:MAG: hypothetical protein Q8L20_14335 [Gammaproteobacteria bacterium]|nr:hypothetical protein [Gammaproteobacteria bacterium]
MIRSQISLEEFEQIVVPLASKIGYMPEALPPAIQIDFISDLYTACQNPRHSWAAQSAMFDGWAALNLDFKYLVESVLALMYNYRRVVELESQGVSRAKLICYKPLPECPDGTLVAVTDLLNGFKSSGSIGVVVPQLDCPRNSLDGGGLCCCALLPTIEFPEDMLWLKEILEPESRKP